MANETRPGWTVGAGAEYAFTNLLSGFIEYGYYDFGSRTVTFIRKSRGLASPSSRSRKPRASCVSASTSASADYAAPVAAKY